MKNKRNPEDTILENPPPVVHPKPVKKIVGSDADPEVPIVIQRQKGITRHEPGVQVPEENPKSTGKPKNPTIKEKKRKIFPWSSKTNKQEDNLQVYEEFSFKNETSEQEARHLVNRTVTLSEFPDDFSTSFKITKLVPIGLRRIGFLSENHSSIFVCGLDGKIQCTNTYPKDALISIVEMADDMIAVLNNKATTIETLKVIDKRFEVKNTIYLKLDISKVTGFDYLKTKSHFAIGTETEYVILDKKGKKIKSMRMATRQDSEEVITVYDFEKSNILIINKATKSLKCVDFQSAEVIWQSKCQDPLFQPESACVYQGKLYIASSRVVVPFSTTEGKPEIEYKSDDLIKNCLGLCVIDNVLAISSNSSDPEESKKLGFLAL